MEPDSLATLAAFFALHVWLPFLPSFLYSEEAELKGKRAKFEFN